MRYLRRFGGKGLVCQLSLCLGLALCKLFVLDFQFGRMGVFFMFWHVAVPDMLHIHFRYII
ncbi:hypothetical protein DVH26_10830 [Paenibacillus sp. H1-7]|nr:hypothetical protein DVH26_10830 [Paenibacillus sp. H1-7]